MVLLVNLDYYEIVKIPWLFEKSAVAYIEDEARVSLVGTVYKYEVKNNNLLIYLKNVKVSSKSKIYKMSNVLIYNSIENQIKIHNQNSERKEENQNLAKVSMGNKLKVTGSINKFKKAANYGQFDSEKYYKSLGIETSVYAANTEIIDTEKNKYMEFLYFVRSKLSDNIDKVADAQTAGIMKAMLLGEKQDLAEDVKELYQKAGASHLIAISGLHLSIIGISVYKLLRKGGIKYIYAGILGILFVISYGYMTGFAISTKRAVIMCVIMIIAGILGRTYDMLTSLCLAAIIMIFDNPYCVFNMGFLLSFGAVAAIGIIFPVFCQLLKQYEKYREIENEGVVREENIYTLYKEKIKKILIEGLLSGISVNLITFPIILSSFYEFPLYSIILNVIIIPIMAVVLYSGVAAMLLAFIWSEFGKMAVGIGAMVLDIYELLFELTEKLPCSTIILGKPQGCQIFLYYAGLSILIIWIKVKVLPALEGNKKIISVKDIELQSNSNDDYQKRLQDRYKLIENRYCEFKRKIVILALAVGVLVSLLIIRIETGLNITMLDIGQGDCLVVRSADNTTIMIDSGSSDEKQIGKYKVLPFLKAKGYKRIDYFIMTHPDNDHISGLKEIIETDYEISHLVMPKISMKDESYEELIKLAKADGIEVMYISKGEALQQGKLRLLCMHPYENYAPSSRNDYSTVISLEYGDFSMLFTGDIEEKGEKELTELLRKQGRKSYDILKVAHHGSKYSTSEKFLQEVNPKAALISAGKDNSYGHPHKELLERLENQNCIIYKTFERGAISINVQKKRIKIESKIQVK